MTHAPTVLFVNRFFHPDHSATSQILSDLAFDLAAQGLDVHVVTSRMRYDDPSAALPPSEVVKAVKVHRVWSSRFGRKSLPGRLVDYLTFYPSAAVAILRHSARGTIVVVKTDPPLLSLIAAPIVAVRGAVLVNWLQDLFPEVAARLGVRMVRGRFLRALQVLRNATLRQARANVVLGSRMEALVRGLGVAPDRIHVIPNWAGADEIRPVAPDQNALRQAWGLEGKFVVGYSGNLGHTHEYTTFLDAASALRARSEIVFLFIGGGAQHSALATEVKERGLDNVLFQPYQPRAHLSESLGAADVHLVSLNPAMEGLIVPSKFYGVAAAARPTLFVGDPDGEIARVVRRAHCGYAFAVGDSGGLADAIDALASDPVRCTSLGRNARDLLVREYDRNTALLAWKQLLLSDAFGG
jgi:colanic acid biosynthesis glycosyl transferase WcaI